MDAVTFRPSRETDLPAIMSLMKRNRLVYQDIGAAGQRFIVAEENGRMVGVAGLEGAGEHVLLRSLAVEGPCRGKGLGTTLVERAIADARGLRVCELYLLTMTAEGFFARLGFERVERSETPVPIQETAEFKSICPTSAVCMKKKL